jgi:hypothetical protein
VEKMNDIEVRERVDQEGLDYAVRHYMSGDSCQNPETAKLWDEAAAALNNLAAHLGLEDA